MSSLKAVLSFAQLQLCYYHAVESISSLANYQRPPGKQAITKYMDDEQERCSLPWYTPTHVFLNVEDLAAFARKGGCLPNDPKLDPDSLNELLSNFRF
jgi:hypothetical protein